MRRTSFERGVGCAAVIPACLIGLAGLADGIGPQGWRGLSEFVGWIAICVGLSLLLAFLLGKARRADLVAITAVMLTLTVAAAFTWLPYWVGLEAPMAAKRAFTSALQVVGNIAVGAFLLSTIYFVWGGRPTLNVRNGSEADMRASPEWVVGGARTQSNSRETASAREDTTKV